MTNDVLVHPYFMFMVCTSFSFLKAVLDITGLEQSLWMKNTCG